MQVVQFQQVGESKRLNVSAADDINFGRLALGEKLVYVGSKRTHTHDVRALAIATPIVAPAVSSGTSLAFLWLLQVDQISRSFTTDNAQLGFF